MTKKDKFELYLDLPEYGLYRVVKKFIDKIDNETFLEIYKKYPRFSLKECLDGGYILNTKMNLITYKKLLNLGMRCKETDIYYLKLSNDEIDDLLHYNVLGIPSGYDKYALVFFQFFARFFNHATDAQLVEFIYRFAEYLCVFNLIDYPNTFVAYGHYKVYTTTNVDDLEKNKNKIIKIVLASMQKYKMDILLRLKITHGGNVSNSVFMTYYKRIFRYLNLSKEDFTKVLSFQFGKTNFRNLYYNFGRKCFLEHVPIKTEFIKALEYLSKYS